MQKRLNGAIVALSKMTTLYVKCVFFQTNAPQMISNSLEQLQKHYQIKQLNNKVIICRLLQLEALLKLKGLKGA